MRLSRPKAIFDMVATRVGILGVIGGALWGCYEYLDNKEAERVKQTLVFVERFSRPPVFDTRRRLDEAWNALAPMPCAFSGFTIASSSA